MNPDQLLEYLISNGYTTQEEFDKLVEQYKSQSPLRQDVDSIKIKTKTAKEIYEELFQNESTTLEELKQARINLLKDECSQAIYDGFISESTGYEFGFNPHDQINFTQQMLLIVADTNNEITTIQWKTKNHGVVELSKEEFLQVIEEAKQHKLNQQYKYWIKEELILIAENKDEIESIQW